MIFCHGLRGSRLEHPPGEVLASLPGLRLICIDRPGYGLSSPLHERSFSDWPKDVEQLLCALGIDRYLVLSFSIGGVYAMALSAALPDRIYKLGLAGTVAPLKGVTDIYRNPERHIDRFMLRNCAPDIALLQQPKLRALYLEALDEGGRFGSRRIAEEMIRLSRDWGFSLEAVRCPTHIWRGYRVKMALISFISS